VLALPWHGIWPGAAWRWSGRAGAGARVWGLIVRPWPDGNCGDLVRCGGRASARKHNWRHSTGSPPALRPFWTRTRPERLERRVCSSSEWEFNEAAHRAASRLRYSARTCSPTAGSGPFGQALAEPAGPSPQAEGDGTASSETVQVRSVRKKQRPYGTGSLRHQFSNRRCAAVRIAQAGLREQRSRPEIPLLGLCGAQVSSCRGLNRSNGPCQGETTDEAFLPQA